MKWIFSLRTKLFVLVFGVLVMLIGIIYWQIGIKSQIASNAAIERSLTRSSLILDTRIESRFRFIREIANGIARDGRVLPLVADQQSLTLQDLSLGYVDVYDFDVLFFMNANGDILARADQEDSIGVNLAGKSSLFDDALNGQLSSGFISSNGKLMQTIAAPIFDNIATDLVKGAVVLSYELSRETAQEIVALTQSQIGFFTFTRSDLGIINGIERNYMSDGALSKTKMDYLSSNFQTWQPMLESLSNEYRKVFLVDSDPQHSVFRRINSKDGNPLGFVVAMRSDTELQRPFREIQQGFLAIGGICLLLASLLALLMAFGMSRPIIRLVDVTKQIQNGLYPSDDLKSQSKSEVGLLQNAIVAMGQSLKDKAEFEAYLAELASEIEADSSLTLKTTTAPLNKNNDDDDATLIEMQQEPRIVAQRYRLLSQLGSGTMGIVYLADDIELDEKVAVKVMQKQIFENVEGLNVKEEIRLARKITHRNIVRTFDFGSSSNEIFITMEYVQGYDLGRLIKKKGALHLSTGLAILKQICSAMIAAHQIGIIHRDLKPGNMIINRQGILKIMDFGLAMQVTNHAEAQLLDSHQQDATESNAPIMGTPRYMAPEQFSEAAQLDERTDIYAIGVIMFTLLNGEPPFSASSFQQLAMQHRNDPVPEIKNCTEPLPEGLREIIHKALAKNANDRFQSVREMLEDLSALESS